MSCGCTALNNAENRERQAVEALAKKYAEDSGAWVAFFQLPCGAWDFCEEKNFDENGKENIQHFAPL